MAAISRKQQQQTKQAADTNQSASVPSPPPQLDIKGHHPAPPRAPDPIRPLPKP